MKNILIYFLLAMLAFSMFRLYLDNGKNNMLSDIIKEKDGEINFYHNKWNNEVARRKAVELNYSALKKHYPQLLKEVKKDFEVRPKNVKTIAKIGTETIINNKIPIDTTKNDKVVFKSTLSSVTGSDKWHRFHGSFENGMFDYEIAFRDSLTTVTHYGHKGLFRKSELFVDVINHNPYSKITEAKAVHVGSIRRKPFGLGAFVGYSPTGFVMGIGLTYSPIRF